jgi:hypothetical protein
LYCQIAWTYAEFERLSDYVKTAAGQPLMLSHFGSQPVLQLGSLVISSSLQFNWNDSIPATKSLVFIL